MANSKVNVKRITLNEENDELTKEDMMHLVENNRNRARTFSNVIISVCSLFISTSFVVLFFIQDKLEGKVLGWVSGLLILSDLLLVAAILFSTLASFSRKPIAIVTRSAAILYHANLYRIESRHSLVSFILMLLGLLGFLAGLCIYAFQSFAQ